MSGYRYYFQCIGTSEYPEGIAPLPEVVEEMDTVALIFRDWFGYTPAIGDGRLENPDGVLLRAGAMHPIKEWLHHPDRTESDVLAVYYTGHGDVFGAGTGYRIIPKDFQACHQDSTSIAPEDLLHGFLDDVTPVRNVLFILDTCRSGEGIHSLAKTVLAGVCADAVKPRAVHVLCSCWPQELADVARFSKALHRAVSGESLSSLDYLPEYLAFSRFTGLLDEEISKDETCRATGQKLDPASRGVFSDFFPLAPWRKHFGKTHPLRDPALRKISIDALMLLLGNMPHQRFRRFMPRNFRCYYDPLRTGGAPKEIGHAGLREAIEILAEHSPADGIQPLLQTAFALAEREVNLDSTALKEWIVDAANSWAFGVQPGKLKQAFGDDQAKTSDAKPRLKIICSGALAGPDISIAVQRAEYWLDYDEAHDSSEPVGVICRSDYRTADGRDDTAAFQRAAESMLDCGPLAACDDTNLPLHFLLAATMIEEPVEHWQVTHGPQKTKPTGAVYDVTVSTAERSHYQTAAAALKNKLKLRKNPPETPIAILSEDDSQDQLETNLEEDVFMAYGAGNAHTAGEIILSGIPYACWSRAGCTGPDLNGQDISLWRDHVRKHRLKVDAKKGIPTTVLFWDDEHSRPPKGAEVHNPTIRPPQNVAL